MKFQATNCSKHITTFPAFPLIEIIESHCVASMYRWPSPRLVAVNTTIVPKIKLSPPFVHSELTAEQFDQVGASVRLGEKFLLIHFLYTVPIFIYFHHSVSQMVGLELSRGV